MITSAPKLYQHQSINPNWSHDRLQQECFQFLWNTYPTLRRTFFHCPNEFSPGGDLIEREVKAYLKKLNKSIPAWLLHIFQLSKKDYVIKLSQRQAIGVVKGVTDLIFYYRGTLYMFDIKLGKDSLSDAQKDFISAMVAQGGVFHEISSLDQFKSIANSIMQEANQ